MATGLRLCIAILEIFNSRDQSISGGDTDPGPQMGCLWDNVPYQSALVHHGGIGRPLAKFPGVSEVATAIRQDEECMFREIPLFVPQTDQHFNVFPGDHFDPENGFVSISWLCLENPRIKIDPGRYLKPKPDCLGFGKVSGSQNQHQKKRYGDPLSHCL